VFRFLTINKKILIAFILLIGIFVLLSPEIKQNPRYYMFERPFVAAIGFVQSGFGLIHKGISVTWNKYVNLVGVQEENQRLTDEVKMLRSEAIYLKENALAGNRLMELLKMRETLNSGYVAASIIAKDPANWYSSVVIDKGEKDGIRPNMGVITADGVVGRIVKTAPSYSRVLLFSDRNSAIAGLIQRTRNEGIAEGREDRILRLSYIMIDADVRNGDIVLTSGTDGIFPSGIPIGSISKVERPRDRLFQTIELTPGVDLSKVREVMVIKSSRTPEIDLLLKEGKGD
jgi:rod shape-determining protein MreC